MSAPEFTLFETAIGCCGIVWTARGIAGVQLPERDAAATRARLLRRYPDARMAAPPAHVQDTIERIIMLLHEGTADLSAVPLDVEALSPMQQRIYAVARSIPPGQTLSYGEIAARIGERDAARDVGQAMGQNPFPLIVPCHRVLAAGGKLGGFSAAGGVTTKLRLLEIEGASIGEAPTLFDSLPLATPPRRR